jgi:hypothetical protein
MTLCCTIHPVAVHLHLGSADDRVEPDPVVALDPLLELSVNVEGHLRVGMPDLAHDPRTAFDRIQPANVHRTALSESTWTELGARTRPSWLPT